MDTFPKSKGLFSCSVIDNRPIREGFWKMTLLLDSAGSAAFANSLPGQFAEFDVSGAAAPPPQSVPPRLRKHLTHSVLLRRPFSFSDIIVHHTDQGPTTKLEILYCVLGPATVRMTTYKPQDELTVIGPLGNGFWYPENMKTALLLAGGMGAPPLQHLAGYLKKNFPHVHIAAFAGAKSCEALPFTLRMGNKTGMVPDEFERLGVDCRISTDDGSAGFKGYVTHCAQQWIDENRPNPDETVLFACGPEPMLAQCAALAQQYNIACQVSMERMMACGIGLCQSCAVEVRDGDQTQYKLCCKDGPVFDSRKVLFLNH